MRQTKLYALALFDLAPDASTAIKWKDTLKETQALFEEIGDLYVSYLMQDKDAFGVIRPDLAKSFDSTIVNFLEILSQDGFLNQLKQIQAEYKQVLINENLLKVADIYSSEALSTKSQEKVEAIIRSSWQGALEMYFHVNPDLLGGLRLEMNGLVIDTSFRTRLDTIIQEVTQ